MGKKPKPKQRPLHPAEQKDGTYEAQHKDRKFEKLVESKMGTDGVPESHITYRTRSTKVYSFPK